MGDSETDLIGLRSGSGTDPKTTKQTAIRRELWDQLSDKWEEYENRVTAVMSIEVKEDMTSDLRAKVLKNIKELKDFTMGANGFNRDVKIKFLNTLNLLVDTTINSIDKMDEYANIKAGNVLVTLREPMSKMTKAIQTLGQKVKTLEENQKEEQEKSRSKLEEAITIYEAQRIQIQTLLDVNKEQKEMIDKMTKVSMTSIEENKKASAECTKAIASFNLVINSMQSVEASNKSLIKEFNGLKSKVTSLEGINPQAGPSYSDVARLNCEDYPMTIQVTKEEDMPKQGEDIRKEIRKMIDPAKHGVVIRDFRLGKNGKCHLRVANKEMGEKIKIAMESDEHFNDKFQIKPIAKSDPRLRFRIPDVKELETKQQIEEKLCQNSNLIDKLGSEETLRKALKVVYQEKPQRGFKNVVVRVSTELRKILMEEQYGIPFFYHSSYAEDHFESAQCYNCCGFGHTAMVKDENGGKVVKCGPENKRCTYCAGEHLFKDCQKTRDRNAMKCINCCRRNQALKDKLPPIRTDHSAKWRECPMYLKMIELNRAYTAL